jgi:hypothetical protein
MVGSLERMMRGRQDGGMVEIVNLRRAKKRLAREAAEVQAAQNRVLHGRTKAERVAEAQVRARAERLLDGARLPPGPDGSRRS